MLDVAPATRRSGLADGPPLDFQQHLAALEAQGLVTRIDRPINKDTELHPLVRWQFQGGLAEDQRRAFLFTHVVDSAGRRYDMPVTVWRELIELHYPNTGWVRLSQDAVAALAAYKSARGLLSIEDAVPTLLSAAHQEAR